MKDFKEILLEKLKVSGNINNYDYKTVYWDRDMFERMITFIHMMITLQIVSSKIILKKKFQKRI